MHLHLSYYCVKGFHSKISSTVRAFFMVKLRNSGFRVTIRNEEQAGINKLKPESFKIDYVAWQHKPEWRIAARNCGKCKPEMRDCSPELWEMQTGNEGLQPGIVGGANWNFGRCKPELWVMQTGFDGKYYRRVLVKPGDSMGTEDRDG